jgi:hypothetical protein
MSVYFERDGHDECEEYCQDEREYEWKNGDVVNYAIVLRCGSKPGSY